MTGSRGLAGRIALLDVARILAGKPYRSLQIHIPTDCLDATRRASERRQERVLQRRVAWADLLQRVFEVDALACPKCGGRMRVLAAITDPTVAARILRCLALPARAPPPATARAKVGPPDGVGESSSQVIAEFDFDQSEPSDDGVRTA